MTDLTLLTLLQRMTLEPGTDGHSWTSGLWTREEVLGYLLDVEREFIRRTPVVRGWGLLDYTAGTGIVSFPIEWQEVVHADVEQAGRTTPCPIVSRAEADQLLRAWRATTGRPVCLVLGENGPHTLQLVPPPAVAGQLHAIVVPAPQQYTGADDPLAVTDPWVPILVQGVLARLWSKPGDAYQPARAAAAQALFDQGIQHASGRGTLPQ